MKILGDTWTDGGFWGSTYRRTYPTRQAAVGRVIRARNVLNRTGIEEYYIRYSVEPYKDGGYELTASLELVG